MRNMSVVLHKFFKSSFVATVLSHRSFEREKGEQQQNEGHDKVPNL